jgi:hypothetical protein
VRSKFAPPDDPKTISAARGGGAREIAIFAAKLLVTGACFWYLSRQIDFSQVLPAVAVLDFRWVAFAGGAADPARGAYAGAMSLRSA